MKTDNSGTGKGFHARTTTPRVRLARRGAPRLAFAGAAAIGHVAFAGNVVNLTSGTALDVAGDFTPGTAPSSATDVLIGTTYPTAASALYLNSAAATGPIAASFGSLNDTSTFAQSIRNAGLNTSSGTSTVTLTLGGGTDAVAGANGADLIYVGTGATLALNSSASSTSTTGGLLALAISQSGNFDVAGTANLASNISTGAFTLTKTGAGTLTTTGLISLGTGGGLTVNAGTVTTGSGTISGTGSVIVNGGTLNLVGTNTYTGGTTINSGGLVTATSSQSLAHGYLNMSGGTYQYTNATLTAPSTAFQPSALTLVAGQSVISIINTSTTVGGRINLGISSAVTGAGGITLAGSSGGTSPTGASSLQFGAVNTYTGPTVVPAGETIVLNIAGSSASSALNLGGGSLYLTTGRTATTTFSAVNLTGGANFIDVLAANNTSAGTISTTSSLGPLTRSAGATVDFLLPTSGTLTTATVGPGTGTIFAGYATANGGASFATVDGSGNIGAYSGASTSYSATGSPDFDAGSGGTFTATTTVNSLRFNAAGAATVDLNGSAFTVATGGILVTPTASTGGTFITDATSLTSGSGTDLIVHQYDTAAPLTIAVPITGSIGVTKSGPGTLVLTASNNYSGNTIIGAGTVQVGNGTPAGTLGTGAIIDNAALAFNQGSGTVTFTSPITGIGSVEQAGTGTLVLASSANTLTGGAIVASGTLQIAGDASLGAVPATATTDLQFTGNGTLRFDGTSTTGLGATRTIYISPGVNATIDTNGVSQTISGQILGVTSGSGTLTKVGAGLLNLTALNDTFGGIIIDAGTVEATAGSSFGAAPAGVTFAGNSTLLAGPQFATTGVGATRTFTFNAGVTGTIDTNGLSPTLGNVFTGGGSFAKAGTGTLTLTAAETYTGNTSVTAGTLALSNSSSSNIIPSSPKIYVGPGTTLSVGGLSGGSLALASGQTLAGSGTVTGGLTVGAGSTITAGTGPTPADTIGTLTTGAETLTGASYVAKLNGSLLSPAAAGSGASASPGTGSDLLIMSGITLTGPATVTPIAVNGSFTYGSNYSVAIAEIPAANFSAGSNPFAAVLGNLSLNASSGSPNIVAGSASFYDVTDASGDDLLVLDFTVAAPEPTTMLLLGMAAVPLTVGRRRRR
jgi:autotransporter-associated beta strand protein